MTADSPRLLTIAPDRPFLDVLAAAILDGSLIPGGPPSPLDLARWTILLPTRRAVREFERVLFDKCGRRGLLLPRLRPLGDIDEDLLDPETGQDAGGGFPEAMTPTGQLLVLIDLIDDWARDNAHTPLAREVAAAPHQAYGLAVSLKELLDSLETEEADTARIPDLFGLESARHREAILEFLAIARERYPQRLASMQRVSSAARRSMVLRHEARRLAEQTNGAPIVAAGSTGSIPATRELLRAIASRPRGAVVLPGLDTSLDAASWQAVDAQHPQYALKQLITAFAADHRAVPVLGGGGDRAWLASELMRPSATADAWRAAILDNGPRIRSAMQGVELIAAAHEQQQAEIIALVLRQALETPHRIAALITPDRTLARRVKAELMRWNVTIDDSGGEPLLRFGGASLLQLVIEAAQSKFQPIALANLMRHGLCRLGRDADIARRAVSVIEIACLRGRQQALPLPDLSENLRRLAHDETARLHRTLQVLPAEHWAEAQAFAGDLSAALSPLWQPDVQSFTHHIEVLLQVAEALAGPDLWENEAGEGLRTVCAELRREAPHLRHCDFYRACAIILHSLRQATLRPRHRRVSRLSILGLLEARLVRPDLVVLGGLNEGVWPGLPDSGPWLNRPMRDTLGIEQPERAIGQTAHDFVQAFGAAEVKLVWSGRRGDQPAIPSRWVFRLRMMLEAAGLEASAAGSAAWPRLAQALNAPDTVAPHPKPKPSPPIEVRPRRLSVTRVETLIRDPYAIYARHILELEPLEPIAAPADHAVRGIIVHDTISDFLKEHPSGLPDDAVQDMMRLGRRNFERISGLTALEAFWWPRFAQIAQWFVNHERGVRAGVRRILSEAEGRIEMVIAARPFILSCRADRVDLLHDGSARIVDYKTGSVPTGPQVKSGLAPQLTLTAAILERGGFRAIGETPVSEFCYIKLGGGDPAGEIKTPKIDETPSAIASRQVAGLCELITAYDTPQQPYLPRNIMEHEDDESPFDHLSRYREWMLAGVAT